MSERFDSRKKDIRYSFGDEDEQLLDELDWTEDLNGNKRKSGYGEDVKQRINNINRYAESKAQARESADMLDGYILKK